MRNKTLVSAFLLAVCALGLWAFAAGQGAYPVLSKVGNDCSVFISREDAWSESPAGTVLSPADMVKTGSDSFAELRMSAENVFRLKSDTEVVINAVTEAAAREGSGVVRIVSLFINDGSVAAMLDNIPDGTVYQVQSPIATAGATGTQFDVSYSLVGDRTDVSVSESAVTLSALDSADKSVRVGALQKSTVSSWETAVLRARGNGILSKKILGKDFVAEKTAAEWMKIENETDFDPGLYGDDRRAVRDGRRACLEMLESRILDMELADGSGKVSDLFADPEMFKLFLRTIEGAVALSQEREGAKIKTGVQVSVSDVEKAVGARLKADALGGFEVISLSDYGARFGAKARLTTIRAAQVDAFRKLAEQIYGAVVTSKTTIADMAAENDLITTRVEGMVKGAETESETYFSDGSIAVSVVIRGTQVLDELSLLTSGALGDTYMASPVKIGIGEFMDIASGRK